MNDELLFVIPIYSMPEEEFDEKRNYKSNEEINFNICKSQQKIYRYDCSQHYFTYCHTISWL